MTPGPASVLVLGGTGEARELATVLHAAGTRVITSLAGRVSAPRLPPGDVRIGGFGGAPGLERWLAAHRPAAVVDATHPFAARVSAAAATACAVTGVPLLRLERPGWDAGPGDRWQWVDGVVAAAAAVPAFGRRALLTLGRQELTAFAELDGWFLVRSVDHPHPPLPRRHAVVLDRGPFTAAGERRLLEDNAIDVLVTRDSGGAATAPKLVAARELGVPVIVIRRPVVTGAATVAGIAEAVDWVRRSFAAGLEDRRRW